MVPSQEISVTIQGSTYTGTLMDRDVISLLIGVLYDDQQREGLKERGVESAIAILAEQAEGLKPAAMLKARSVNKSEWPVVSGKPSYEAAIIKYANALLIEGIFVKITSVAKYTSQFSYLMFSVFPDIPRSICRPPYDNIPGVWRADSEDTIGIVSTILETLVKKEEGVQKAEEPASFLKVAEEENLAAIAAATGTEVEGVDLIPDEELDESLEVMAGESIDALGITKEVIQLLAEDKTTAEIAEQLGRTEEEIAGVESSIIAMEGASRLDENQIGMINELLDIEATDSTISDATGVDASIVAVVRQWSQEEVSA